MTIKMKMKITLLAFLAVVMSTTIFATPIEINVSGNILSSFSAKFAGAKEVSWNNSDSYVKATFKMNDQYMFAYFTESGDMIGAARNLVSNQLPFNLQMEIKKAIDNGWITELFEFANDTETSYYVTIENADQRLQLKSTGYNTWSVYRKTKKS